MRSLPIILLCFFSAIPPSKSQSTTPYGHGWIPLAPIASGPRQEHSVTAIGEIVYIIGGIERSNTSASGFITLNTVEAYDTRLDRWSSVAPLPIPLNHANAASVDGKIYVLGGLNDSSVAVGNTYRYDPAEDQWTELGLMPAGTQRGGAAVGVLGTKIYLAGGLFKNVATIDESPISVDLVSAFDTRYSTWTPLPSLPARRDHVGGAIVNQIFYVLGGRDRGRTNVRDTVFALDLHSPSLFSSRKPHWVHRARMPTARGGVATGIVKNKIYIIGGEGNPASGSRGVFPQNEVYDPRRDAWGEAPAMPVPRHGTGAVAIGKIIYIPGGGVALAGAPTAVNDGYRVAAGRERYHSLTGLRKGVMRLRNRRSDLYQIRFMGN